MESNILSKVKSFIEGTSKEFRTEAAVDREMRRGVRRCYGKQVEGTEVNLLVVRLRFFLFHLSFSTRRTELFVVPWVDWPLPLLHGQTRCSLTPAHSRASRLCFCRSLWEGVDSHLSWAQREVVTVSPDYKQGNSPLPATELWCAPLLRSPSTESLRTAAVFTYRYFNNSLISLKCRPLRYFQIGRNAVF